MLPSRAACTGLHRRCPCASGATSALTPPPTGCSAVQGAVQHAFYGKPKATNQDEWDRLIAARDQRILEEWRQKQG